MKKYCLLLLIFFTAACSGQQDVAETAVSITAVPPPTPTPSPTIPVPTANYHQSDQATFDVELGQLFALRWDQSATIQSENLTIIHTTEIEFECPTDAVCEVPLIAFDYFEVIQGEDALGIQEWQPEMIFGNYQLTTVRPYSGYDYDRHQFEMIMVVEDVETAVSAQQTRTANLASVTISSDCDATGSGKVSQFIAANNNVPELHMLGIRKSSDGQVDVIVERTAAPIILVLSAYEPTEWQLQLQPGVSLHSIILNGYNEQTVVGAEGVPLIPRSGINNNIVQYVSFWSATDLGYQNGLAPAWVYQIESIADAKFTSFTGCYQASQFKLE